jgi:hypothetical protein
MILTSLPSCLSTRLAFHECAAHRRARVKSKNTFHIVSSYGLTASAVSGRALEGARSSTAGGRPDVPVGFDTLQLCGLSVREFDLHVDDVFRPETEVGSINGGARPAERPATLSHGPLDRPRRGGKSII